MSNVDTISRQVLENCYHYYHLPIICRIINTVQIIFTILLDANTNPVLANKRANSSTIRFHGRKTTPNCTIGHKRHIVTGDCVSHVTLPVRLNHHFNHVFRPHEPYINDATPIEPINAIPQIPWMNDYQPIEPIEDEDDYDSDGDFDEYDRSIIRRPDSVGRKATESTDSARIVDDNHRSIIRKPIKVSRKEPEGTSRARIINNDNRSIIRRPKKIGLKNTGNTRKMGDKAKWANTNRNMPSQNQGKELIKAKEAWNKRFKEHKVFAKKFLKIISKIKKKLGQTRLDRNEDMNRKNTKRKTKLKTRRKQRKQIAVSNETSNKRKNSDVRRKRNTSKLPNEKRFRRNILQTLKEISTKNSITNNNQLEKIPIFPFKLRDIFQRSLKSMLMMNSKRGKINMEPITMVNAPSSVISGNTLQSQLHLLKLDGSMLKNVLQSKLSLLTLSGAKRGLILPKPKVDKIKMKPLKDAKKLKKRPEVPKVDSKMQEPKEIPDIPNVKEKMNKGKKVSEVPDMDSKMKEQKEIPEIPEIQEKMKDPGETS